MNPNKYIPNVKRAPTKLIEGTLATLKEAILRGCASRTYLDWPVEIEREDVLIE